MGRYVMFIDGNIIKVAFLFNIIYKFQWNSRYSAGLFVKLDLVIKFILRSSESKKDKTNEEEV